MLENEPYIDLVTVDFVLPEAVFGVESDDTLVGVGCIGFDHTILFD